MNKIEELEAKVILLQRQVSALQGLLAPKAGGNVLDEDLARRVVQEYGGDWEAVKGGAKDGRSCNARACAVRVLREQAGWSVRRVAETFRMSRQAVQKLRKLALRLANLRETETLSAS